MRFSLVCDTSHFVFPSWLEGCGKRAVGDLKAASEGMFSAFFGLPSSREGSLLAFSECLGLPPWHRADSAPSVTPHVTDNRLNCLQRSNYLNKDDFSFAGVTERSPQTKKNPFGSDLFLQRLYLGVFIYLLSIRMGVVKWKTLRCSG